MHSNITYAVKCGSKGMETCRRPSSSNVKIVTRESLFKRMQRTNLPTFEEKFDKVATDVLSSDDFSRQQITELTCQLRDLKWEFTRRWQKVRSDPDRFIYDNHLWLRGILTLPIVSSQKEEWQRNALETLAMFVEADLSERQYEIIRGVHVNLYPKYNILEKAKIECYPSKGSYRLKETCPEIELQNLLNVTAARLLLHLGEVLRGFNMEDESDTWNCNLTCHWGYDGDQSPFERKLQHQGLTDSKTFLTYFIPVHLTCDAKTVWHNPKMSSQRYCRPIRLRYVTGKTDVTEEEINYVEHVISLLKPFKFIKEFVTYNVNFILLLNNEDAEISNAAIKMKETFTRYMETIGDKMISQRIITNDMQIENVLNQMVLRSDPLLTSMRPKSNKTSRHLKRKIEESDSESVEDFSVFEENRDDTDEESWSSSS